MEATIKAGYKTTCHDDGTVSYWNVYTQQWERREAGAIEDRVLASMTQQERDRIARTRTEYADLVLCESPDGFSLHAPGSTDEDIATGDAPYLVSGPGKPSKTDYARALAVLAERRRKE